MRRFTILFASLIIGAMLINSCSDSDKSTDGPAGSDGNYFPSNIGTYWVYQTVEEDDDDDDGETTTIDSVVVLGKKIIEGKNASIYANYEDKEFDDDKHYYSEGSKYFAIAREFIPEDFIDFIPESILGDQWINTANTNSNANWVVFEKDFENISFDDEDEDVLISLSGNIKITGVNKGKSAVQTPAGTFNAVNIEIKISFDGTYNYDTQSIPLKFALVISDYYSENIGLIKSEMKRQSLGGIMDVDATTKILLRYNIAE